MIPSVLLFDWQVGCEGQGSEALTLNIQVLNEICKVELLGERKNSEKTRFRVKWTQPSRKID